VRATADLIRMISRSDAAASHSVSGRFTERPVPIAPPAADLDHRHVSRGDLAENDHVLCHCDLLLKLNVG